MGFLKKKEEIFFGKKIIIRNNLISLKRKCLCCCFKVIYIYFKLGENSLKNRKKMQVPVFLSLI